MVLIGKTTTPKGRPRGAKPKAAPKPPVSRLKAPVGGIISAPKGVAPGYGISSAGGKPIGLGSLNTPSATSKVGLAQGWGVEYDASGKPVRFVQTSPTTGQKLPVAPNVGGMTGPPVQSATKTSTSSTPPIDPLYDQEIAGLQRQRDTTISGLRAGRTNTLLDYGYNARFGDSSNPDAVTGLDFDPSNPFSRAALMLRNYNQQQTGSRNSMAARGQLYSGALVNQTAANEFGYGASSNALQRALIQMLTGVQGQIGQAGADYELGAAGAAGRRYGRTVGRAE